MHLQKERKKEELEMKHSENIYSTEKHDDVITILLKEKIAFQLKNKLQ